MKLKEARFNYQSSSILSKVSVDLPDIVAVDHPENFFFSFFVDTMQYPRISVS